MNRLLAGLMGRAGSLKVRDERTGNAKRKKQSGWWLVTSFSEGDFLGSRCWVHIKSTTACDHLHFRGGHRRRRSKSRGWRLTYRNCRCFVTFLVLGGSLQVSLLGGERIHIFNHMTLHRGRVLRSLLHARRIQRRQVVKFFRGPHGSVAVDHDCERLYEAHHED